MPLKAIENATTKISKDSQQRFDNAKKYFLTVSGYASWWLL